MSPYPINLWEPFKDRHYELMLGSEQAHDQYWINELINILVLKEWYMNQKKLPIHGATMLVERGQYLWVMQGRIMSGQSLFVLDATHYSPAC